MPGQQSGDFLPDKPKSVGDLHDLTVEDDFADSYLSAAILSLLRLTESPSAKGVCAVLRRREDIASTCILAFLSLEACINRLFFDTFDSEPPRRTPISSIPSTVVCYVQRAWPRMSVREKWLVLPALVSLYSLDVAAAPFTLFDEFIRFRNRLVHPKVVANKVKLRVTEIGATSWSGNVVDHMSDIPPSEQIFPLTRFSNSFNNLEVSDAGKCVEISYRMRMALALGLPCSPPVLFHDRESKLSIEHGASIGKLLGNRAAIYFGPLPE